MMTMSLHESKKQDRALDRKVKGYEKELQKNYQASLKKIRAELAELYAKSSGNYADAVKYNRLSSLEKQIAQEIKALTGKTTKTIADSMSGTFEEARLREMFVIEKDIKATADFTMMNKSQIKEAVKNPYDRIGFVQRNKDNADVLVRQIREEITQGLIQGKSFQDTARSLKNRMEIGGGKALTIVRTETKKARGIAKQSTQEEALEMGVKIKKQWLGTIDDKTRDSHASIDGTTIDLDEQFDVDGEMMDHPGDPAGSAENVINCRCTILSVIEGYEPTSRRIKGEGEITRGEGDDPDSRGTVDYTTFEKWKETRK